jgi:hypothetical protein
VKKSTIVKVKIALGDGLGFQAQIEKLCLKCGIPLEGEGSVKRDGTLPKWKVC